MRLAALVLALVLAPLAGRAQPLADAPALSAPGAYAVGVRTLTFANPGQPDLLASDLANGKIARRDRVLPVTVWYPTAKPKAGAAVVRYMQPGTTPAAPPVFYRTGGAYPDAAPVSGQHFPLVVLSHGYRNWATSFADLAENLASKGYVVASIEHRDLEPKTLANPQLSFATTLITRVADQRFVIAELTRTAGEGPLRDVYDPDDIALVGYSMGGFGALTTLGAGLDPQGPLYKLAPFDLLKPFTTLDPDFAAGLPKGVKAMVALAPWGGAPPLRAWSAEGLAQVSVPTLLVVGDQDDVSGYDPGVAWLYANLAGADRRMLVYENARHNIALDGVTPAQAGDFKEIERHEEPVWRRDRILAINRHFITAFLDQNLKGDGAHGAYLAVPTPRAADGTWSLAPGASVGDRLAGPDDANTADYWPGFQRRWALGLRLLHAAPGSPPDAPR
ncbi:alpha/beta hydrolase family protein [Caulobacter hibisci]|uniref:Dienelactone hydrolase n=1 Tax=Caulobacter hibisci TaxID=2035993 RepID=A0ABS0SU15_9CAUL|nr:dienelactone hydrolase [Caulobacter hibisci]MBI1682198.1 dienelactone hydrolase [Caulobacter hibisci]